MKIGLVQIQHLLIFQVGGTWVILELFKAKAAFFAEHRTVAHKQKEYISFVSLTHYWVTGDQEYICITNYYSFCSLYFRSKSSLKLPFIKYNVYHQKDNTTITTRSQRHLQASKAKNALVQFKLLLIIIYQLNKQLNSKMSFILPLSIFRRNPLHKKPLLRYSGRHLAPFSQGSFSHGL